MKTELSIIIISGNFYISVEIVCILDCLVCEVKIVFEIRIVRRLFKVLRGLTLVVVDADDVVVWCGEVM